MDSAKDIDRQQAACGEPWVQMFVIDRQGKAQLQILATRDGMAALKALFTSLAVSSPGKVDAATCHRFECIPPLELSLELVDVEEDAGWLRRRLLSPHLGLHRDHADRVQLSWRLDPEGWLELAAKAGSFLSGLSGGFTYLDSDPSDDLQPILGYVHTIPDQRDGIWCVAD